ncbi:hypothetical protein [Geminicoccus harenae]|uniref:hypothetical protein n=1 Tax=Geminicoccus harenae TaxID=2498453 RepID=UPI00168A8B58|nr:hypothetical protein [Geminicoccus harenae]
MPLNTTPILGVNLSAVTEKPTHRLGTATLADDGRKWVYAYSAATSITAAQALTLNSSTFNVSSAGSGTYDSPVAVPAARYFWARQTAL